MTVQIDHVAEARRHIDRAHEQQAQKGGMGNDPRDEALLAQAEATLALVEQHRIANLIALWKEDDAAVTLSQAGFSFPATLQEIFAGLGL